MLGWRKKGMPREKIIVTILVPLIMLKRFTTMASRRAGSDKKGD